MHEVRRPCSLDRENLREKQSLTQPVPCLLISLWVGAGLCVGPRISHYLSLQTCQSKMHTAYRCRHAEAISHCLSLQTCRSKMHTVTSDQCIALCNAIQSSLKESSNIFTRMLNVCLYLYTSLPPTLCCRVQPCFELLTHALHLPALQGATTAPDHSLLYHDEGLPVEGLAAQLGHIADPSPSVADLLTLEQFMRQRAEAKVRFLVVTRAN